MDGHGHRTLDDLLAFDEARPLGDALAQGRHLDAGVSSGLQTAADNLIAKALRAVEAGDPDRARGYVDRALRLPFDEHNEAAPGWFAASMLVFNVVTDAAEACDTGDSSWLSAAEEILPEQDRYGRLALADTLRTIAADYGVLPAENRRIRNAVRDSDPSVLLDSRPDGADEQAAAILSVVGATAAYRAALAAAE